MTQVKVSSIMRKLFVQHNDKLVEVEQIDNTEDYDKSVTIYTKDAVKGANKGTALHAVAVADFIPKKRKSNKESIKSLLASGMTAEEIVASLLK